MSEATQPVAAPAKKSRGRWFGMYVLLVVAGLLLLVTSFAVWINRVALNTEVFSDTASELIQDDEIRAAVAQKSVDELFANVDVEAAVEERLPEDVKSLAGPSAAALQQVAPQIVDRALEQPALQALWVAAVEEAHKTLVRVLEGDGDVVSTEGGVVELNLRDIVLEASDRLGIRAQVDQRLPADAGRIEVLQSDELDTAQNVFQLLKTLAWVLPILTVLAFLAAVWIAPDRRRVLRGVGITTVIVGVLGLLASHLTGNYVVNEIVKERDSRPAADNAWDILTNLMRSSFWLMIVVGTLFVVAWWLAGYGRTAIAFRRNLAPILRDRWWAYGALAVVGVVLLLTSPVSDFARYFVVALLLVLGVVWIERTRAQALREFPDAGGAVLLGDTRTKAGSWWDARQARAEAPAAAAAPADVSAKLANLTSLHAQGALTDEEFASAKARVLAGE